MSGYLEKWVETTLANRMDKSWAPLLFASPAIATAIPKVAGFTVRPDDDCEPGTLEIRGEAEVKGKKGVREIQVMARYSGIHIAQVKRQCL